MQHILSILQLSNSRAFLNLASRGRAQYGRLLATYPNLLAERIPAMYNCIRFSIPEGHRETPFVFLESGISRDAESS